MDALLAAVAAGLFIYLFVKLFEIQSTVKRLNDEVAALRRRNETANARVEKTSESVIPPAASSIRPPLEAVRPAPAAVPLTPLTPVTPPPVEVFRVPVAPPSPLPPPPSRLPMAPADRHAEAQPEPPVTQPSGPPERRQWEALIGGNLFNYIGAIALFIGLAFLLKFAIDNNWITPPLRVLCGYLISAGLLVTGNHFHRKGLPVFSQGVVGAGVAVCYLCGFAAYVPAVVGSPTAAPMISYPVAFVLMSLAALLAFQQSLRYNALPIALLGWVGGLLTPFILHSGHASLLSLYCYLLLFTAGMVAIVARKIQWLVLEPMTLCAVYLIYLIFCYWSPTPALLPAANPEMSLLFLLVLALLFQLGELYRIFTAQPNDYNARTPDGFLAYQPFAGSHSANVRQFFGFLNGIAVYGCLYLTLAAKHHLWLIAALLLLAVGFALTALGSEWRRRDANSFIARSLLMAFVAVTMACWHYYSGFPRIIAWMVLAVIAVSLGVRWQRRYLTDMGLGIACLAYISIFLIPLLYAWNPIQDYLPIVNLRVLALVSTILGLGAMLRLLRRDEKYLALLAPIFHYAWSILVFLLLAFEDNDCFRRLQAMQHHVPVNDWAGALHYLTLGLVLIIAAVPFMKIGWSRALQPLAIIGFLANLVGIVIIGVQICFIGSDYTDLVKLVTRGTVLLPVLGALLLAPKSLQRACPHLPALVPPVQYLAAFVLGFEAMSLGVWDGVGWMMDAGWPHFVLDYPRVRMLLLGLSWTLYALPAVHLALRRQYRVLLVPAYVAAIIGWLHVTMSCFDFTPLRQFQLLYNFRALSLVTMTLLLLLLSRLTRSDDAQLKRLAAWRQTCYVLAVLTGFQLIGVEMADYANLLLIQHIPDLFGATPPIAGGLIAAGCWSLYALVIAWIALRRRFTPLLIAALSIFAVGGCVAVYDSFFYQPIGLFFPARNLHALVLLGVTACVVLMERQLKRAPADLAWLRPLPGVLQVSAVLILYCALAQETWLAYSVSLQGALQGAQLTHALDIRQAALSIASIVFALGALGFGFLRQMLNVRVTALVIFCAAILKVFLYDISRVETIYRIISFIGLGVLLLAASYLYNRYRNRLGRIIS